MNEVIEKEEIKIEDMIYEIRGKQVMLDSEMANTKCHCYFYVMVITLCGDKYYVEIDKRVFNLKDSFKIYST